MRAAVLALWLAVACAPPAKLGKAGHPCASDADCDGLACLLMPGECPGTCVTRPQDGEKCGPAIAPCEGDRLCVEGRCAKPKALGEPCAPGREECASPNFCDENICVAPGGPDDRCGDLPVGGPHDFNTCESELRCTVGVDAGDGVCVVPAEPGEVCGPTRPCRTGWCDGVCEPAKRAGASCEADDECQTGCVEGKCAAACG